MKQSRRVSIGALGPSSLAAAPFLFLSFLPSCGATAENPEGQSTSPVTAETADAQSDAGCVSRQSTLSVEPSTGGPVTFDALVHFKIAITDNDVGPCAPRTYRIRPPLVAGGPPDPALNAFLDSAAPIQNVKPGATAIFGGNVIASESATLGVHSSAFTIDGFPEDAPADIEHLDGQVSIDLIAPTGCFVFQRQELVITDPSVVDDPVRTFGSSNPGGDAGPVGEGGVVVGGADGGGPGSVPLSAEALSLGAEPRAGVWSFGHLMRQLAPRPEQAPAMTLRLFQHWLADQTVNGFVVPARPAMQQQLIDLWPRTANGDLDLDQAPLTLQAIVNRVDIRDLALGSAGEGRFIFGVNGPGNLGRFTVILEYNLRARTERDVLRWAKRWHALSSHPFPSEEYNEALEKITRSYTDGNAAPGDGRALVELRTNEIALAPVWELRGFVLSPTTGFFEETTVKETPDLGFKGTQTLAAFVNENAAAIKSVLPGATSSTIPAQFEGRSFLAGSVLNDLTPWNAPGIIDPDARFHLSINSCNGCHGSETNTAFLMILPRPVAGTEAQLAPFMRGTAALDPFSGQVRVLYDLGRRQADLASLVCPPDEVPAPPGDAGAGRHR
jgi:hypothetical protein